MIRTRGSVPEGRTRTRPRPSSAGAFLLDRGLELGRLVEAVALVGLDAVELLGELLEGDRLGEVAAAERAHRQQGGADAVAGRRRSPTR